MIKSLAPEVSFEISPNGNKINVIGLIGPKAKGMQFLTWHRKNSIISGNKRNVLAQRCIYSICWIVIKADSEIRNDGIISSIWILQCPSVGEARSHWHFKCFFKWNLMNCIKGQIGLLVKMPNCVCKQQKKERKWMTNHHGEGATKAKKNTKLPW